MAQLLKNNVSGVLSTQLDAAGTSMVLVDASNFPSPADNDFYLLTLVGLNTNGQEDTWEVVKVTAKASNTLTVVRAQEGTTAATWPVGATVQLRLTAGTVATQDALVSGLATKEPTIAAGTTAQYRRGDHTWQTLNKAAAGLGNVDNTSDVDKPVSTATQTALDATVKRLDVGASPAQVPAGQHLGKLAYMDELASLRATLVQPQPIGAVWVERVSDTSIKLFMRGSDGVARSTTLTLS